MNIETGANVKNRIVDLLRYKTERAERHRGQRSLDFDSVPGAPRPRLATIRPFRPLTAHEVAHRQQMVAHLARQKSEGRRQK
ncbi:MAG TPA: hypothetical protein VFV78_08200 [Vicinamibacterales bacterium]|nr:hypothetical protein [Vicinamibacterales bacterium]